MIKVLCNLIIPGLGSLLMKKPVTGLVQLLMFLVAALLTLSVFLTFLGLLLWAIDLIWALTVSISWWRGRNRAQPPNKTLPVRQCDCESSGCMTAVSHRWDLYNAATRYKCESCYEEVDIIPLHQVGYILTVGLLFVAMASYFYIWNPQNPSIWVYVLVVVLGLFQAAMTFAQLAPHFLYPISGREIDCSEARSNSKGVVTTFLCGMVLPLLLMTLLFGVALLLGYVHDFYFPKP